MRVADDRQQWIDFSSNDYLGLAREPSVMARMQAGVGEYGAGSGASALITGYHPEHQALEQELADFLRRDAALMCSSGFLANLCGISSLAGRGDSIIQDRLCHASLIDAARLSGAHLRRFQHADLDSARQQLKGTEGHRLLVSDGVFSMDGDSAPAKELSLLASEQGATLVIDDAHGIGVLGQEGRGLAEEQALDQEQLPVLIGTLGKAFGTAGAFIAGSQGLIEHLINEGRSYIYSTAIPPSVAAATRESLRLIRAGSERRDRLHRNIARFVTGAKVRGLKLEPSRTPIQPLVVGDSDKALALSEQLSVRGFLVVAIRPPTVPDRSARLRITLSSEHEKGQLESLLETLSECLAA